MMIDYVLDPHLSCELPVRVRRRPHAANAVVCLSKHGVVNESMVFAWHGGRKFRAFGRPARRARTLIIVRREPPC
jgi:hypothetical protein